MKLFFHCFIAFILLSSNGCDNPPLVDKFYSIKIINESSKNIHFYLAGIDENTNSYPDTTLALAKPNPIKVDRDSQFKRYSRVEWKHIIEEDLSDTLSIFIFDSEVYEIETWEIIRDNYNILKRYDLSLGDLERKEQFYGDLSS